MAYSSSALYLMDMGVHRGPRRFAYFTADSLATVLGSGYFSDGGKYGLKIGDIIDVFVGTLNTAVSTTGSTAAAGAVSDFSALTGYARTWVTVSNATTFAVTVVTVPQQVAPTTGSLFSVWGATATTQPTATQQAAVATTLAMSGAVTSYGYTTSTQADGIVRLVNQIRSDLVAVGIIKGS